MQVRDLLSGELDHGCTVPVGDRGERAVMHRLRQWLRLRQDSRWSVDERGRRLRTSRASFRGMHWLLDQAIGGGLHAPREERRSDAHEKNRDGHR